MTRKPEENQSRRGATEKQIRGSSLLLLGKLISVGLNFVSQVLLVRYLSTSDFGAWGIGLAIVAFFQTVSSLGLKRSISRFIPIYHENKEYAKLFGTLVLVLGTIGISSVVIIGAIYLAPQTIADLISGDAGSSVNLLLIMIFLVPVEAIDLTLVGLFASFTSPKIILYQKHLLGPLLRLTVVILLMQFQARVEFLAYGYLGAFLSGVIIYTFVFVRQMRRLDLLKYFSLRNINIPAKEIFAFTLPLLTSDLVSVLMHSTDTLFLGHFQGTTQVAMYRVALPAAHFNKLVMTSFTFLFTPLAARLFARKDFGGINHLYWQTAIWMGVLSFPVFALTFSMAKPLTLFLYGARYEQSWVFLQLLSFGYYFNVLLGFNGLTLKVLGKVRYVVVVNVIASVANVVGNLILIPRYGALGATIATTGSMVLHNILKQAGLRLASGISIFNWHYLSYYGVIIAATVVLLGAQRLIGDNIYISVAIVAVISSLVLFLCQKKLDVTNTFPEIRRVPLVGKWLARSKT